MSLAELLSTHKTLVLLPNNRIQCQLTKHELPARVDAVQAYLQGGKYKKALKWSSFSFDQYAPYIVQHKTDGKKLFCKLTEHQLNKIPEEVLKHVNGKRYKRYSPYL